MKTPLATWGLEPVSASERQSWSQELLVNGDGVPTSDLSAQLLRLVFATDETGFEIPEIAAELFLDPRHAAVLVSQLRVLNLVEHWPGTCSRMRVTRRPWNQSLMTKVREWLQSEDVR